MINLWHKMAGDKQNSLSAARNWPTNPGHTRARRVRVRASKVVVKVAVMANAASIA